ncbi:hypothetical protein TrST_g5095 [Triparma strigata]|uniref:Uncharacterized protein n=1 Tax=Triparma strigata TaxID=1606541 RepID=A0A9W7AZ87_9STRA|nr:hypothetical protein TrST_g5095 [Triparma strigata]
MDTVPPPPSSDAHVSKRDLQMQLNALQKDVADLTKALDQSTPTDDDTIAKAIVEGVGGKSFGEIINQDHVGSNGDGFDFSIDIPEGASTLLSQLARTQRALKDTKLERDKLARELQEERSRTTERRGSISPVPGASTTEALAKMRQLYESLEKDHQLMSLTLENSEKIRVQQKELILLLQDGGAASSSRGRRLSQSPAPRARKSSPRVSPDRRERARRVTPEITSDYLITEVGSNSKSPSPSPSPSPPTISVKAVRKDNGKKENHLGGTNGRVRRGSKAFDEPVKSTRTKKTTGKTKVSSNGQRSFR